MRGTWIVSAVFGLIVLAVIWMFAESIYRQWKAGKPLSALETHQVVAASAGQFPALTAQPLRG